MAAKTIIYELEGILYEVTDIESVHAFIREDSKFAANYFKQNSGNVIMIGAKPTHDEEETPSTQSFTSTEVTFSWSHQAVLLLLEEYRSKKQEFRDPKIKKSQLWKDIGESFSKKGYYVNVDLLSNKFRNLKKTYTAIVDNKSKTGRGRVTWEYFDLFQDIFSEDRTLNVMPNTIMSSCIVVEEVPSMALGVNSNQTSSTSSSGTRPLESKTPSLKEKKSKSFRWKQLEEQRKRLIQLEQERITQLQKLTEAVETNNNIQIERNNMFKEYLEHLKTKKQ